MRPGLIKTGSLNLEIFIFKAQAKNVAINSDFDISWFFAIYHMERYDCIGGKIEKEIHSSTFLPIPISWIFFLLGNVGYMVKQKNDLTWSRTSDLTP